MIEEVKTVPHAPMRKTECVSMTSAFGIGSASNLLQKFIEPGPLTPEIDSSYVFPKVETTFALMSLSAQEPCYLVGHSGTGKTALVSQIAARLNYNLIQVNFDGHVLRSDLLGALQLRDRETYFKYGLLPTAFMLPGTILCLDEADVCPPDVSFVMQRAISEQKSILLTETNEVIRLHPQNAIFGTANTKGTGDETGLYFAGTQVQNFSFLNRWKTYIEMDYMDFDTECSFLKSKFSESFEDPKFIESVVRVLHEARAAFRADTISQPLTTRDGINWLKKTALLPHPLRAARYAFLNRMPVSEARAIAGFIESEISLPDEDDRSLLAHRESTDF